MAHLRTEMKRFDDLLRVLGARSMKTDFQCSYYFFFIVKDPNNYF